MSQKGSIFRDRCMHTDTFVKLHEIRSHSQIKQMSIKINIYTCLLPHSCVSAVEVIQFLCKPLLLKQRSLLGVLRFFKPPENGVATLSNSTERQKHGYLAKEHHERVKSHSANKEGNSEGHVI